MAEIVGYLAMSHAPQLMLNPEQWNLLNTREWDPLPVRPELEKETLETKWAKWKRCQEAIEKLRHKLDALSPDIVVVVGDDQHENILEDNTPPFTIFVGQEAEASVSLRYLNQAKSDNKTRYGVEAALGAWVIDQLMESGFDPAYSRKTRYEGGLGHAFARPLKFLMPEPRYAILPIMVNTYYPPAPSPKRCVQFGRALASAIRGFSEKKRVVIAASGGLSHTKIDEELDRGLLEALQKNDTGYLERMPASELVGGTSEIRNWIVTASAADKAATIVEYTPLYRTNRGVGCAMGFAYWT